MSSGPVRNVVTSQPQERGPLFVVSMWRSGSSLLYTLLNKHPQVGLMYEADLLLLRSVFLKPSTLCDWVKRWEFWNQALTRHQLREESFSSVSGDFKSVFERVHQQFAGRKGATIWGDKSPNYYDRLQELAKIFPDARFIILWRNPIATVNSILRAAQAGNPYFRRMGSSLRGMFGYGIFKRQCDWLRTNNKPVLEISYEELTSSPGATMQQVCRFLAIPYHANLADLAGSDRSAIYDGQHHALVKGDAIVSGTRPSVVDASFRAKTDRYVNFWRRRYREAWPPYYQIERSEKKGSSLFERAVDSLEYRALRTFDRFTALCFSFAPIWLLHRYRERKYRNKNSAQAPLREPDQAALHASRKHE